MVVNTTDINRPGGLGFSSGEKVTLGAPPAAFLATMMTSDCP